MPKQPTRSRQLADAAFREVKRYPPERVRQTERTRGKAAAERQLAAIALGKARKQGGRFPKR